MWRSFSLSDVAILLESFCCREQAVLNFKTPPVVAKASRSVFCNHTDDKVNVFMSHDLAETTQNISFYGSVQH